MKKTNKVVYNACYGGFSLSRKAAERLLQLGVSELEEQLKEPGDYFHVYDLPRHDPRLVKVVEELGAKANGSYAKLKIAKIAGKRYQIDEYDGFESVLEPDDHKYIEIE